MSKIERKTIQLYCRIEVEVTDPGLVLDFAEQEMRGAGIDWPNEPDRLDEAVSELRADLFKSIESLANFDGALSGVPGVTVRGGRWWAVEGPPSPRFQPGYLL